MAPVASARRSTRIGDARGQTTGRRTISFPQRQLYQPFNIQSTLLTLPNRIGKGQARWFICRLAPRRILLKNIFFRASSNYESSCPRNENTCAAAASVFPAAIVPRTNPSATFVLPAVRSYRRSSIVAVSDRVEAKRVAEGSGGGSASRRCWSHDPD